MMPLSITERLQLLARGDNLDLADIVCADAIAEIERLTADAARLDFLDQCNARLNARFGTTYRWKLILNHNVNRLFIGSGMDVDLADMHANGLNSCRDAIEAEMKRTAALFGENDQIEQLRAERDAAARDMRERCAQHVQDAGGEAIDWLAAQVRALPLLATEGGGS